MVMIRLSHFIMSLVCMLVVASVIPEPCFQMTRLPIIAILGWKGQSRCKINK